MPQIPELREYAFWTDERRAIVIRAHTEEQAWSFLDQETEQPSVVRVEKIGQREVPEHERQLLAKLAEHPSWPVLRQVCREKMEEHFRRLGRLFATKGFEPDYPLLQWHRGFFAGMKFLLDNPLIEDAKLKRALDDTKADTEEGD